MVKFRSVVATPSDLRCQTGPALVLTSVTSLVHTYHVQRTELVCQWHMYFPLLRSQAPFAQSQSSISSLDSQSTSEYPQLRLPPAEEMEASR